MRTCRFYSVKVCSRPSGGCLLPGGCPLRGICSWGVSAPGFWCLLRGGGVYPSMHWGRNPPCGQNSWHTLLKILPCPKLRLRAVKKNPARQCLLSVCHFWCTWDGFSIRPSWTDEHVMGFQIARKLRRILCDNIHIILHHHVLWWWLKRYRFKVTEKKMARFSEKNKLGLFLKWLRIVL